MHLTIIIPVYNETAVLPRLLDHMRSLRSSASNESTPSEIDIVFADGGSTDASVQTIRQAGFDVISTAKGRAWQMNAGAAHTRSDALLFLHADTQLPTNAVSTIQAALAEGKSWGRFDVRLLGKPWMLVVVAHMINWRSRISGIATGDQAMFMTRVAYEKVGGFPGQALMEDIEMSKRLKRLSKPACIASPVTTSGRRWETRGVWRTIFLMWRLRWAYWRGVHPNALAKLYA